MAELFLVRSETADRIPTTEGFSAINSATNQYIDYAGTLAIFNEIGSDCVVKVKRIEINELVGRSTVNPWSVEIKRTTAITGGETIAPIKMDTNDASLPSQVSIVKYGTATRTGNEFRKQMVYQNLSATGALRMLATPNTGPSYSHLMNVGNSHLFTNHDSNIQGYVIREGEGVTISGDSGLSEAPPNYPVDLAFCISNGSACYLVRDVVMICGHADLMTVHNGSGSGVVLTVNRIRMSQILTDDIIPAYTLETISGCYNGTDITPVKMDTNNTTVPSGVKIKRNCTVTQINADASQFPRRKIGGDLPIRRVSVPPYGKGPNLATFATAIFNTPNGQQRVFNFSTASDSDGGHALREGEGLAILSKPLASAYGMHEIVVFFTNVYTPSGGGSSEHAYTFVA